MRRVSVGKITLGLVLTVLGTALLLDFNYDWDCMGTVIHYWPVFLIVMGLEFIVKSRDPESHAYLSVGAVAMIAVVLGLAWAYGAGGSVINWGFGVSYPGQATHTVELPFDLPFGTGSTKLEVKALGDVTLTGKDMSRVVGTALVTVRARTEKEARQVAEKIVVRGNPVGGTLYLEVDTPGGLGKYATVHPSFALSAPSSANVCSKTVSGDTGVTGITGAVTVTSVSGDINISGMPTSVSIDSVSGDVTVTLSKSMKNLGIKTVSGDVHLHAPSGTGGTLTYSSVSGEVVSSLPGVETSKGPGRHTASGRFGEGTTGIEMTSVSGDLTIR